MGGQQLTAHLYISLVRALIEEDLDSYADQENRIYRTPDQNLVRYLFVGFTVHLNLLLQAYQHMFHGCHLLGRFIGFTDVSIVIHVPAKMPEQLKSQGNIGWDKTSKTVCCHDFSPNTGNQDSGSVWERVQSAW